MKESSEIRTRYRDRVPLILEKREKSDVPEVDKSKFLLPGELLVSHLLNVIRKRMSLPPEKALFIFCANGTIPQTNTSMGKLYEDNKDEDGFLYIEYSGDDAFGDSSSLQVQEEEAAP